MAGTLAGSWSLVKASADVLKMDKELMIFPVFSGVTSVLVTASFFAPLAVTGGWEIFAEEGGSYLAYVLGFLFYLVQYTVIFFFNSALVGAALIRMEGGDPTVGDGLRIAMSRLPAILGYAALASTVGMVLRFLSERAGFVGRMVIGLVGMAWNLATFLVVPVLVTQNLGPVDAVKESATLFRRTWGEQVVGSFGMGWAFFLMGLAWTLVMGIPFILAVQTSPVAALSVVVVAVVGYVLLGIFSASLRGVYTAALYRYATKGDDGGFANVPLDRAFRPR
ncbi:MAG: hypothetical protein JSU98_15255 [Gemmatimonadales bacterium]|jgi:hypothetical protein|nr:MAG: hypothetical protein JSU98_15255 [Gemmatimonadales bacterium]